MGQKKCYSNINLWKATIAKTVLDKVDFRAKTIHYQWNKGHLIRPVKGPINQEDKTILNI